ncbi:putative fmi2 protein [Diplogelasinospora grovesii]|uniref:Fmi2 protein n=1 Tax=Diplogelasinospora grovesii TaxID=303347 RepID=A0AAN6S447_9PEZI|nr:putative fmi2 protein [Diplogelasinospora grovesii]
MMTQPALARGVRTAAPYTQGPPSPPAIIIPSLAQEGARSVSINPSTVTAFDTHLTPEDLAIITGGRTQTAVDPASTWQYEARRLAQPILDFLYLGPNHVVKNSTFMAREGITFVLVIADSLLSGLGRTTAERARQMGLAADVIYVSDSQDLIRVFSEAVGTINSHLLDVYHRVGGWANREGSGEGETRGGNGEGETRGGNGKVLVCCETGNERSAAIVAAYLMSVFGKDSIRAMQFIGLRRFCVNFDDDMKYLLKTYEDILFAQRDVRRASPEKIHQGVGMKEGMFGGGFKQQQGGKRRVEDLMEVDDEMMDDFGGADMDAERYHGRGFAPFVERQQRFAARQR